MKTRKNSSEQDLFAIYSPINCLEMVNGLTNVAAGVEVEGSCRALLPIFDLSKDAGAVEAAGGLMRAAFNESREGDDAFRAYLDRLRERRGRR